MASIELNNICKSYGTTQVLRNINISIANKEFLVLVGPSGCGKSTLLRMIAGLESITGGNVLVDETDVTHKGPQDRDLAMVFQSYALYPHMTTHQNIAFPLKLRKLSKSEIDGKVKEAADILQLTDYLDRFPKNLSGGQRQRVAMGRAIVRSPRAFLFDEPLSNLDAKLRTRMRAEIKGLHKQLDATSVYVTHDQIEAMTMADRIVVMNHGNIEQIGTPLDLFDAPANIFVASFLGAPTMNLFKAKIVEADDVKLRVDPTDGCVLVPGTKLDNCQVGQKIWVGIRPQHITLGGNDKRPSFEFEGKTIVAEQTGCETNLVVQMDGLGDWTIQSRSRAAIGADENVTFRMPIEDLHLFDETGTVRLT